MNEPEQDKPQDLSIKPGVSPPMPPLTTATTLTSRMPARTTAAKKVKHIPPPLDLNACNLEEPSDLRTPKSPGDLPRECLPLRKRPLLDQRRDLNTKSPKSAGPADRITFSTIDFNQRSTNTAPSSPITTSVPSYPHFLTPSSTTAGGLILTPSSASSLSAFAPFSIPPPPLIPVPSSTSGAIHPAAAVTAQFMAAAAAASAYPPKSPFAGGFPTPPTELAGATYNWASPTAALSMFPHSPFSPVVPISPLPFTSTAMLSPAPSHPSSTNSSREELPLGTASTSLEESKRRYLSSAAAFSSNAVIAAAAAAAADCQSPSSPLPLSPLARSWPTPSWQCFMAGSKIRFLLPNTNTPWQKAEELGWKDRLALKVDSRNSYQFAPNGLAVLKVDIVTTDTVDPNMPVSSKESDSQTILLLRMGPHRTENAPDILVECALNHPFFVKDKGWSSPQPRLTFEKYGIPCRELSIGDVCLPPDHQDVVRTPDLCDRFRRFEFTVTTGAPTVTTETTGASRSSVLRPVPVHHQAVKNHHVMSPPVSPARRKEKDNDKPKRPMNGFMLFAKKFRLELIQQHPGKDNRAISVLLGEAWKGLPTEEREQYSQRAKLLADEQKKLYPDCWKRKRTMANNSPSSNRPAPSSAPVGRLPAPMLVPHPGAPPMIGATNLIKQESST